MTGLEDWLEKAKELKEADLVAGREIVKLLADELRGSCPPGHYHAPIPEAFWGHLREAANTLGVDELSLLDEVKERL